MKLWVVQEQNNLKQITPFRQSSQLENWFRILKIKHSLPLPLQYSQITHICSILDPYQGIDDCLLYPTSKSLCGSQVGMKM
jgi:hypothetical protein